MSKVTKDMIIADIVQIDLGIVPILMGEGMHCVTCPAALGETLEEACMVHGIDPDYMERAINEYLEEKESESDENNEEIS